MRDYLLYVEGKWCPGGAGTMPAESPSTGKEFATVAVADLADVERAVAGSVCGLLGLGGQLGLRTGRLLRGGCRRHRRQAGRPRPCTQR